LLPVVSDQCSVFSVQFRNLNLLAADH
jgi:hypothetical protein